VAGGFAAGSVAEKGKFLLNTVYAPSTVTTAETFLWYSVNDDLRLGVAHLWKQNAFRGLAALRLSKETETMPAFHVSAGVQGIGTGNPGYSATAEKNFHLPEGNLNVYLGIGFRSNESHAHEVAGAKFQWPGGFALGVQHDGHATHPFMTYSWDRYVAGFYLIEGKSGAYMLGVRF
jgi:hypothetical protein